MSFTDIAAQFTEYYYKIFDEGRGGLRSLYRPHSMLSFETQEVVGDEKIIHTLVGLPFGKVKHAISTINAQPSGEGGNILVLVTGHLVIDDSEHPQGFSQCFNLIRDGGSYYVLNDIFRLTYPA